MAKKSVFYSFHFDKDVLRVQQIRQIGALEGDEPVSKNEWESLRRNGDRTIEAWIDKNMKYKHCVVVLVGEETARRPWVLHEIQKAWNEKRGLVGIRIHSLKCPNNGLGKWGANPFDSCRDQYGVALSNHVTLHDPNPLNAYSDVAANLAQWIDSAIDRAKARR
jgi:hypothetical protein